MGLVAALAAAVVIPLILGAFLISTHGGAGSHVSAPTATAAISAPDGPVPDAIETTERRGTLAITLRVVPPAVGPTQIVVTVSDHGTPLTGARVRIRLSMPVQPVVGSQDLAATPMGSGYRSAAQILALGRWRAEVRLYSPASAARAVAFDFMSGANARFLFAQPWDRRYGPATVILTRADGVSSTLRVLLHPGLTARAVQSMPNMFSMGTATYPATAEAGGWYVIDVPFPMTGVNEIDLQVRVGGVWRNARTLLYDVDSHGRATLLTNTPS